MSTHAPNARLTLAGRYLSRKTIDTTVSSFDAETIDVAIPDEFDALRFAWVEFDLPNGRTIRPLVEVTPVRGVGVVTGRIRHLFPEDRKAIERLVDFG